MAKNNYTKEEFQALKDAGNWDSDACETPQWLFDLLDKEFNFFWDACCSLDNCKIKESLYQPWELFNAISYLEDDIPEAYNNMCNRVSRHNLDPHEPSRVDEPGTSIFINPPYSNPAPFLENAWEDSKHFRVVALVRDDPSVGWYKRLLNQVQGYDESGYFNNMHTIYANDMADDLKEAIKGLSEQLTIIRLPERIRFEYKGKGLPYNSNFPHCLIVMDRRDER